MESWEGRYIRSMVERQIQAWEEIGLLPLKTRVPDVYGQLYPQLAEYADDEVRDYGISDRQQYPHVISDPGLISVVAKTLGLPPWSQGVLIYPPPSGFKGEEAWTCPVCGQGVTGIGLGAVKGCSGALRYRAVHGPGK